MPAPQVQSPDWADNIIPYDTLGNVLGVTLEGVAYVSAPRTATPTAPELTNPSGRGLVVVIDATAITATPSVVFTIQGKDPASGKWYNILVSAAVATVSTVVLRVAPGLVVAANLVANDVIPRTFRILATHGDADSITYSVGYILTK